MEESQETMYYISPYQSLFTQNQDLELIQSPPLIPTSQPSQLSPGPQILNDGQSRETSNPGGQSRKNSDPENPQEDQVSSQTDMRVIHFYSSADFEEQGSNFKLEQEYTSQVGEKGDQYSSPITEEQIARLIDERSGKIDLSRTVTCDLCDRRFISQDFLFKHKDEFHPDTSKVPSN